MFYYFFTNKRKKKPKKSVDNGGIYFNVQNHVLRTGIVMKSHIRKKTFWNIIVKK